MRASIFAALAILCAAVPSSAQEATKVYRGEGYEVTVPAECEPGVWAATNEFAEMQPIHCGGRKRVLFVSRVRPMGEPDTTRAKRVADFADTREGLAEQLGADALSEGTEFERPDRLGWRMDVRISRNQLTFRGRAEVSFDRSDNRRLWIVLFVDRTGAADTMAVADRILDSFRITGAAAGDGPSAPPARPR